MNTIKNPQFAEYTVSTNSSHRRLVRVVTAHTMSRTKSFEAYSIGRGNLGDGVDPFLQIDHFFMSAPIFSLHPHAGFSAVMNSPDQIQQVHNSYLSGAMRKLNQHQTNQLKTFTKASALVKQFSPLSRSPCKSPCF